MIAVARWIAVMLALGAPDSQAAELAGRLTRATRTRAGLIVHVGAADGRLTAALGRRGNVIVHGLALDAASVPAARRHLRSRTASGAVSIEHLPPAPLPYAENTVNLLVADDLPAASRTGMTLPDVLRVLVPGGAACLKATNARAADALRPELQKIGAESLRAPDLPGRWVTFRKPWPKGMGDWPNFLGRPDGTRVADDTLVGPPRRLKWIDGPTMNLTHTSQPRAWVSAGGRVFYVYDERHPRMAGAGAFNLVARDAFNGKLLWRKAVPGKFTWSNKIPAVVATDRLLVAPLGPKRSLLGLDPVTGETLVDYGTNAFSALACADALIIKTAPLRVVDAATGRLRWTANTYYCGSIAADGDRVYAFFQRHTRPAGRTVRTWGVGCFDLRTGKDVWFAPLDRCKYLAVHRGRIVCAFKGAVTAFSAKDGRVLWTARYTPENRPYSMHAYCIGDRVWCYDVAEKAWVGLDLKTGEQAGRLASYARGAITHHFFRCSGSNATVRFLISGNTMDFMEVATGVHSRSLAARSSCIFGIRTANGMVYTFPVDCSCFGNLRGVLGMAPEAPPAAPADEAPRLIQGGACGQPVAAPATKLATEWPCYRHDPARSGGNDTALAARLEPLWQADVGPDPTAPTVAGGMAFVASRGTNRLTALHAATGKQAWTFTAGGPLDTPPTIHNGLCVFGCRDGRVYCLRAADGRLLWRFRVPPAEQRLIAFGRLESPTPVGGSVVVAGDTVYCSAGHSSELDSGVWVCGLDLATGRLKWRHRFARMPLVPGEVLDKRTLQQRGILCDLLTFDGDVLRMGRHGFDPATGAYKPRWGYPPVLAGFKRGFLDETLKQLWSRRPGGRGNMLVFRGDLTCGFSAAVDKDRQGRWTGFTTPAQGQYTLFARRTTGSGADRKADVMWTADARPIAVEAMALAGDKLLIAGPPDHPRPTGGLLRSISIADGRTVADLKLPAPPVFDSLAAAAGRAFLSTRDGKLLCFGSK